MAKEYAKKFYNSKAWLKCRKSYIDKVFGICEHCQGVGYIVDHIIEINPENIGDAEITLNHDNLQYLCLDCHNKKTFGGSLEVLSEGLGWNEEGQIYRVYTPLESIDGMGR